MDRSVLKRIENKFCHMTWLCGLLIRVYLVIWGVICYYFHILILLFLLICVIPSLIYYFCFYKIPTQPERTEGPLDIPVTDFTLRDFY